MAFTPRFKEKIVKLATLHTNLEPHLAELPQLASDHATLTEVLAELTDLESRQDRAKGELRRINRRRDDLERQGRALRRRLAEGLRGAYGLESPELHKFGIRPRPLEIRRRRRSATERAEQAARKAARARAQHEAEVALKAAIEAKRRASLPISPAD